MTTAAAGQYEGHDLEALSNIPNYYRWIVDSFTSYIVGGRTLEVGAGIGSIARIYAQSVREAVLVEPAKNLISQLEDNTRSLQNVRVVGATLEEVVGKNDGVTDFSPGSFDATILINVLEHIEDDVAMLHMLHDLLRPSAALILFVPALSWLFGSLDEVHFHKRRYSDKTLRTVVERASFSVEVLRYFDFLGVAPWFVAGRVMRQRTFNKRAAELYDRVAVPVGARFERFITPPIGKNLLCIARRK